MKFTNSRILLIRYKIYISMNFAIDTSQRIFYTLHMPFQVVFRDSVLAELAANKGARSCYGQSLEKKIRQRIQHITTAIDERDFYALKSLHYEKLKGDRDHQYSMRLNDQYRLIIEYEGDPPNRLIWIIGVEDYH